MIKKEDILNETSKKIIKEVTTKNSECSSNNHDEVFGRIINSISQSERLSKRRFARISSICGAAAVACIMVLYSINTGTNSTNEINYTEIAQNFKSESKDIVICVNDSQAIEIKNNANIEHNKKGGVKINNQLIEAIETDKTTNNQTSQIIVPKSKRAEVLLSDGTKVTLNSDSRIIYATNFDASIREVYIEGEAFLDVAKDINRPFIVKTKKFTVNVTGTKFNVTSYNNDNTSSVVLVEGKVNIDIANKPKMHLNPGQMMHLNNQYSKIESVDTYKYTCWMDKIMIFENQSLKEVADRISRFYDIHLVINSSRSNMTINGKLDLKDNSIDVINTLSTISNLKITKISNSIILTD